MAARARHLLHVIPSFGVGGVPIRLARLFNHFGPRYRHSIVALDGVDAARQRIAPEAPVTFLRPAIGKGSSIASLLARRRFIRETAPDVLLTYNWGAVDWAMANRLAPVVPHVHQEDGFGIEEAAGQLRRRVLWRRLALGRTAKVVVPSHLLETIARDEWRIPPDRLVYVPNGIDVERFAAARPPEALAAELRGDGARVVGTVAPLRPEKTLHHLVEAFARLDATLPCRLVIAGDGVERPRLEALAAARGLEGRVRFLGNVDEPDRALHLFDVFAISSETEQMPTTIIEAMAAGLAVAGFAVGDIANMVSGENAPFLVPKGDVPALAAALAAALGDAARRQAAAAANQAKARAEFRDEQMFRAYAALYDTTG